MLRLWHNNYLPNKPIEDAMRQFGRRFQSAQKVLDIGCGYKPYARYFSCQYIGLDPLPQTKPDIIGDAWRLPFPPDHFDGVILNQSLEHILKTTTTIAEIKRVLKPDGWAIITVPQTMKNHSVPIASAKAPLANFDPLDHPYWQVDYWRFTKYGLIYLFRDFQIVSLRETTGFGGTLFQLANYFWSSFGQDRLLAPLYFLHNLLGLGVDAFFRLLGRLPGRFFHKLRYYIYTTLTINYILIVRKYGPSSPPPRSSDPA